MSLFGLFGKTTDPVKIMKQVAKRREHALKTGFPQLVNFLYHFQLKYYPNWIENPIAKNLIPTIVTNIQARKESSDTTLLFAINGRPYTVRFHEPTFMMLDKEEDTLYRLELFQGDKKVLALRGKLRELVYIDAFHDGKWMSDFRSLKKAIETMEIVTADKSPENTKRLEELKQNFDIT